MTLAKRIRDCRYAKGWGPDELAQKADISRTALYQIECGKTETPRAGTLRRIAKALDVPIERLLGRAGDPVAPNEATVPLMADTHPIRSEPASYGRVESASRHASERFSGLSPFAARPVTPPRDPEIVQKFKIVLASPIGDSVGRIIEEAYRLLHPGSAD